MMSLVYPCTVVATVRFSYYFKSRTHDKLQLICSTGEINDRLLAFPFSIDMFFYLLLVLLLVVELSRIL